MSKQSTRSPSDKWKQVLIEAEYASTGKSNVPKSRIPISGILCLDTFRSTAQPSSCLLVSTLPQESQVVVLPGLKELGIQNILCPFEGIALSLIGFPVPAYETLKVIPFAQNADLNEAQALFAPKLNQSAKTAKESVSPKQLYATGICYGRNADPPNLSTVSNFKWIERRLQADSTKGAYTSFFVRVEKDVKASFWGAPIVTSDGRVESIVVHQRCVNDETLAIVGMQIDSFAAKYPASLTPLTLI